MPAFLVSRSTSRMALVVNNPSANAGDKRPGSSPGLGRSPGEGNSNTLQYSCLENPMDRGPWRATVHGVTKSRTRLSDEAHSSIVSLSPSLSEVRLFLSCDSVLL